MFILDNTLQTILYLIIKNLARHFFFALTTQKYFSTLQTTVISASDCALNSVGFENYWRKTKNMMTYKSSLFIHTTSHKIVYNVYKILIYISIYIYIIRVFNNIISVISLWRFKIVLLLSRLRDVARRPSITCRRREVSSHCTFYFLVFHHFNNIVLYNWIFVNRSFAFSYSYIKSVTLISHRFHDVHIMNCWILPKIRLLSYA